MLYYCDTENFGDDLNHWLWGRLAPELLDERTDQVLVGIGTILGPGIPAEPRKFVFGSGWSGGKKPLIGKNWAIYGVRGPLTAEGLGLKPETVVSDPALLVRRCLDHKHDHGGPIGFMPHHRSVPPVDWDQRCRERKLRYIDPCQPIDTVLERICGCGTVLAEAMHGAIVADALRIPWIPVRMYSHINEFKWRDWCGSLGLSYQPVRLPPVFENPPGAGQRLRHLWKRALAPTPLGKNKWSRLPLRKTPDDRLKRTMDTLADLPAKQQAHLSSQQTSDQAEERQLEALERLRADW